MRRAAWGGAGAVGLILALAFWPLGVTTASVRAMDSGTVSPAVLAAFQAEPDLTHLVARSLAGDRAGRGLGVQLLTVPLMLRLWVRTSADQRAAWAAQNLAGAVFPAGSLAIGAKDCFGTSPDLLSPADAATLVAMVRLGPSVARRPEAVDRLHRIRDTVLQDMARQGALTDEKLKSALNRRFRHCDGRLGPIY